MANIVFNTPFTKSFVHSDITVGLSAGQILAPTTNSFDKRVLLLIQNQHSTAEIEVIFAGSGSSGIKLYPKQSISLENYNGAVQAVSDTASTPVHIAYALV